MKTTNPQWPATKTQVVLGALLRIGWRVKRQKGSHRTLGKVGWPDFVFAYHDRAELGPVALQKLTRQTDLRRRICNLTQRMKPSSRPVPLPCVPDGLQLPATPAPQQQPAPACESARIP